MAIHCKDNKARASAKEARYRMATQILFRVRFAVVVWRTRLDRISVSTVVEPDGGPMAT